VDARERGLVLASRGFFPRDVLGARANILFSQFFLDLFFFLGTAPFGKETTTTEKLTATISLSFHE